MVLKHYIITRFSILDVNTDKFILTRTNTKEEIINILFDNNRLNFKFSVFDKMTYPSIINQTYKNYVWLIFASAYLPEEYKIKLNKYTRKQIKIIYVKNFQDMDTYLEKQLQDVNNYTTIRLDDDDGLCNTYLEELNKYKNNNNCIISFPNGIKFKLIDNQIIYGLKSIFKKNAQGMTAINFNIFNAGNHMLVDKKYNVIYDNYEDAYFLCCSEYCDTKRNFT